VSAKFRVSCVNGLNHAEAPLPPPEQPPDDDGQHLSFRETVEADVAAPGATAESEKPSDTA